MNSLDSVTQINVPLLRKTLEYAEAHPEEIALGSWASRSPCGTTACIAGTAVILAGHAIDWANPKPNGDVSFVVGGRHIEEVACEELNLTELQADDMFYCSSLAQAWQVAEELTDGEIQRPMK